MNELFEVHMLNDAGKAKARELGKAFGVLLEAVETVVGKVTGPGGREVALLKTKLEEASFFAKKAMALQTENQLHTIGELGLSVEARAKAMFNAYNAQGPNPGKTWDGKDVPAWELLGPQVTAKWMAAAMAATKP